MRKCMQALAQIIVSYLGVFFSKNYMFVAAVQQFDSKKESKKIMIVYDQI